MLEPMKTFPSLHVATLRGRGRLLHTGFHFTENRTTLSTWAGEQVTTIKGSERTVEQPHNGGLSMQAVKNDIDWSVIGGCVPKQ